jgi:hypothetical protein
VARTFHRQGNFASLTTGQSHSGGQLGTLLNGVINTAVLLCLISNSSFIRLAGFATGGVFLLDFFSLAGC